MKPTHKVALKPGTPASSIVGTSGNVDDRVLPEVPSARTRPALIIGAMVGTESNIIWICPLRMSLRAPVEPLYGTCTISMPVRFLRSSPAM